MHIGSNAEASHFTSLDDREKRTLLIRVYLCESVVDIFSVNDLSV